MQDKNIKKKEKKLEQAQKLINLTPWYTTEIIDGASWSTDML